MLIKYFRRLLRGEFPGTAKLHLAGNRGGEIWRRIGAQPAGSYHASLSLSRIHQRSVDARDARYDWFNYCTSLRVHGHFNHQGHHYRKGETIEGKYLYFHEKNNRYAKKTKTNR